MSAGTADLPQATGEVRHYNLCGDHFAATGGELALHPEQVGDAVGSSAHVRMGNASEYRWRHIYVRRVIVIAMLCSATAEAEDPPDSVPVPGGLTARARDDDTGPLLRLDPIVSTPLSQSLLATVERREAEFDLGHAGRALFTAEHWKDVGTNARGMSARFELSHDFGLARLIIHGGMTQVDSRYESGTVGLPQFRGHRGYAAFLS